MQEKSTWRKEVGFKTYVRHEPLSRRPEGLQRLMKMLLKDPARIVEKSIKGYVWAKNKFLGAELFP